MTSLGLGYYGSWLNVVSTITTNQQNLNLWTHINNIASTNYGWNRNGGKKLRGIITINSGVNIYSSNPLTPAMSIPADSGSTFRSYDQIIIINNGTIAGSSGIAGTGNGNGKNGGDGGLALKAERSIIINNNGILAGGGGGGGAGGCYDLKTSGSSSSGNFFQKCRNGSDECCCDDCNLYGEWGDVCSINSPCNCGGGRITNVTNTDVGGGCIHTTGTLTQYFTTCTAQLGGSGGVGRGALVTNSQLIGEASPATCRGKGGDGGEWGQIGSKGDDGCTTPPNSLNPTVGGNGGNGGNWVSGQTFVVLNQGETGQTFGGAT